MIEPLGRRQFIRASAAGAVSALGMARLSAGPLQASTGEHRGKIFKSVKFGMVRSKLSTPNLTVRQRQTAQRPVPLGPYPLRMPSLLFPPKKLKRT